MVLALGSTSHLLQPDRVLSAASYNLFYAQPPPTPELESSTPLKSSVTAVGEIILEVTGNMTLAHVNKIYALPSSFVPPKLAKIEGVPTFGLRQLRSDILPHLYKLFGAAKKAGIKLAVLSAYRSYFDQERTFYWWVSQIGWNEAIRSSARPGHSEHQLGTTVDLALESSASFEIFSQNPAAGWVARNAHRFGFTVSYQKGKEAITGYIHEPWHIRWIGVELSTNLYQKNLTLEEYLSP